MHWLSCCTGKRLPVIRCGIGLAALLVCISCTGSPLRPSPAPQTSSETISNTPKRITAAIGTVDPPMLRTSASAAAGALLAGVDSLENLIHAGLTVQADALQPVLAQEIPTGGWWRY